jgi:hypothetical protein
MRAHVAEDEAAEDVEDDVVRALPFPSVIRIRPRVMRAELLAERDVRLARHCVHLGAEHPRDLDRHRADAAGSAVHEHALARREPRLVAVRLERGETDERRGGGVFVAHAVRNERELGLLARDALGERAAEIADLPDEAEHALPRGEAR